MFRRIDTLLGLVTIGAGLALLLYFIPQRVVDSGTIMLNPSLFPNIAGGVLVLLGALQLLARPDPITLPSWHELGRMAALVALTVASVVAMRWVGYLAGVIGLMAAVAVLLDERRPLWLGVMILATPTAIWLVFEILLRRPLP